MLGPWGGHANGRIPLTALARVPGATGHHLRVDAADALGRLIRQAGNPDPALTGGYRTYQRQVDLYREKLGKVPVAEPGTSNHGYALAADCYPALWEWLHAHERDVRGHGWVHPSWAKKPNRYGRMVEPWHWEYHADLDRHPGSGPPPPGPPDQGDDDVIPFNTRGAHVEEFQHDLDRLWDLSGKGTTGIAGDRLLVYDGHYGTKTADRLQHMIWRLEDPRYVGPSRYPLYGKALYPLPPTVGVSTMTQAIIAGVLTREVPETLLPPTV